MQNGVCVRLSLSARFPALRRCFARRFAHGFTRWLAAYSCFLGNCFLLDSHLLSFHHIFAFALFRKKLIPDARRAHPSFKTMKQIASFAQSTDNTEKPYAFVRIFARTYTYIVRGMRCLTTVDKCKYFSIRLDGDEIKNNALHL